MKKKTRHYKNGGKAKDLAEAVEHLRRGRVIAFPTETVYGLAADAINARAVARVAALKGRSPDSPLPVLVADEVMLRSVVTTVSPLALRLIERFWPGPLTLVMPGNPKLSKFLLNRKGGIGVRISSHPIAQELVARFGSPITATSANPSGQDPARTRHEVIDYFGTRIGLVIEAKNFRARKASTVAEILDDEIRILREGEISLVALQRVARRGV